MTAHDHGRERLEELLLGLELGELDSAERAELDGLLAALGGDESDALLEGVASDVALVHATLALERAEVMPADLRARVASDAERWFGAGSSGARRAATEAPILRPSFAAAVGWIAAVAAAIALVVVLMREESISTAPESRAEFIARVDDEIEVAWAPTADPLGEGVTGDVVWSATEQRGYMRFRGLRRNDPNVDQYQLWIIDGTRPDDHPVDGGVFDCNDEGEVIVPIDAKLHVGAPAAFAITLEQPGGVVVSKREHLFLLAQPGG